MPVVLCPDCGNDISDVERPPTDTTLEQLVSDAWSRVRAESPSLFEYIPRDEHRLERALCFRLGVELDALVRAHRIHWGQPWARVVVDSELHRAGSDPKLERIEAPDIVVHVRGCQRANLLVMEAKHGTGPDRSDLSKLGRLRRQRCYLNTWAIGLVRDGDLRVERVP